LSIPKEKRLHGQRE